MSDSFTCHCITSFQGKQLLHLNSISGFVLSQEEQVRESGHSLSCTPAITYSKSEGHPVVKGSSLSIPQAMNRKIAAQIQKQRVFPVQQELSIPSHRRKKESTIPVEVFRYPGKRIPLPIDQGNRKAKGERQYRTTLSGIIANEWKAKTVFQQTDKKGAFPLFQLRREGAGKLLIIEIPGTVEREHWKQFYRTVGQRKGKSKTQSGMNRRGRAAIASTVSGPDSRAVGLKPLECRERGSQKKEKKYARYALYCTAHHR